VIAFSADSAVSLCHLAITAPTIERHNGATKYGTTYLPSTITFVNSRSSRKRGKAKVHNPNVWRIRWLTPVFGLFERFRFVENALCLFLTGMMERNLLSVTRREHSVSTNVYFSLRGKRQACTIACQNSSHCLHVTRFPIPDSEL
jgi:hypothetical protein